MCEQPTLVVGDRSRPTVWPEPKRWPHPSGALLLYCFGQVLLVYLFGVFGLGCDFLDGSQRIVVVGEPTHVVE